jgi:hypothetical protein
MNRHHYSLFVHNCKLVFLLRQEYAPDRDLNEFKPAEWRWKLPQVCDNQWHHYAVSVDFPQVTCWLHLNLLSLNLQMKCNYLSYKYVECEEL